MCFGIMSSGGPKLFQDPVRKLQLSFLVDNLTPFSFVVMATYITTFYFWFETGLQLIVEVWILVISIQYKIVDCRFFMSKHNVFFL